MDKNKRYVVTFLMINDKDKRKSKNVECDSLVQVTRTLLRFKPTRGYEVVQVEIDPLEELI